jgi:hypothetical protein
MFSGSMRVFALLAGIALATAACGSQAPSTSSGTPASTAGASPTDTAGASPTGTGSPTGAASPAAAGICGAGVQPAPQGNTLTLGSSDNGTVFCLRVGQQVMVYLHGSPAQMWAPIRSDATVLRPAANGRLMLARGVTGAAFTAARPGTAHITSARPVCAGKSVRCDALIAFRVTLVVAVPGQ